MSELLPILILLAVIAVVILRLPRTDLGHTPEFRRRRLANWLPVGFTYAFLYMGRYNLEVSKRALGGIPDAAGHPIMGTAEFATIFGIGTAVYGVSFLINGPLTDRYGGKATIIVSAIGAAIANVAMALGSWSLLHDGPMHAFIASNFLTVFAVLYGVNMYFQSFGAVAIVKSNAPWFHVRERGVFGAIFGILISLGIYFAFDWGALILEHLGLTHVFVVPAVLLAISAVVVSALTKNTPGEAGHTDFDTADASSGDDGARLSAGQVLGRMFASPIIMTIAAIEFCSGFLRQAIMQWYRTFAKNTNGALGNMEGFIYEHWGMFLCCAGILGGVLAGVISDRLFQSRRGPVAGFLYGIMVVGGIALAFVYKTPAIGAIVVFMSMAVIGVHGMLSGTASMDFGGRRNAGIAVGIIDGFVYAGTAVMSITYAFVLPEEQLDAGGKLTGPATDPDAWFAWPLAMIPFAVLGFLLALRVWNAKPERKTASAAVSKTEQAPTPPATSSVTSSASMAADVE